MKKASWLARSLVSCRTCSSGWASPRRCTTNSFHQAATIHLARRPTSSRHSSKTNFRPRVARSGGGERTSRKPLIARSEDGAAEKHMAQLQHNMWVIASRTAVLSIITGGGKWVEMTIPADPLYQHLLLTAERK